MALAQVAAGTRAVISHVNQYYEILKGVTGETITLIYNAAPSIKIQPSSDPAASTDAIQVNSNAGTVLGAITYDGKFESADGTAALPGHTFDDDTDTGLYRSAANTLDIATLGVQRVSIDTVIKGPDGLVGAPGYSFIADPDTGVYRSAANTLDLSTGGTARASLASTGLAMTVPVRQAKGADLASAATVDLATATGNYLDVTGTTTITALGTVQAGAEYTIHFTGALTLTHNATSLILQGATNLTTAAGDVLTFVSLGSGNWREKSRRLAAAVSAGTTHTLVRKTADESVTASTALQNDDHLLFAVAANEVWAYEFVLFVVGAVTGGIRAAVTVPVGATMYLGTLGVDSGANSAVGNVNASATATSGDILFEETNPAPGNVVLLKGIISNGSTAGNCQLQWAQLVSDATASTVKALSYLVAHKIA